MQATAPHISWATDQSLGASGIPLSAAHHLHAAHAHANDWTASATLGRLAKGTLPRPHPSPHPPGGSQTRSRRLPCSRTSSSVPPASGSRCTRLYGSPASVASAALLLLLQGLASGAEEEGMASVLPGAAAAPLLLCSRATLLDCCEPLCWKAASCSARAACTCRVAAVAPRLLPFTATCPLPLAVCGGSSGARPPCAAVPSSAVAGLRGALGWNSHRGAAWSLAAERRLHSW